MLVRDAGEHLHVVVRSILAQSHADYYQRGLPVIGPSDLADVKVAMVLGVVGSVGARERIRSWLLETGRREGSDFIFAA